jgi:hypothetical protein
LLLKHFRGLDVTKLSLILIASKCRNARGEKTPSERKPLRANSSS